MTMSRSFASKTTFGFTPDVAVAFGKLTPCQFLQLAGSAGAHGMTRQLVAPVAHASKIDTVSIFPRPPLAAGSVNHVFFRKLTRCQFPKGFAASTGFQFSLCGAPCALTSSAREIDTVSISWVDVSRSSYGDLINPASCCEPHGGVRDLSGVLWPVQNISLQTNMTGLGVTIFLSATNQTTARALPSRATRVLHGIGDRVLLRCSTSLVVGVSVAHSGDRTNGNSLTFGAGALSTFECEVNKLTRCQFIRKQGCRRLVRARPNMAGQLVVRRACACHTCDDGRRLAQSSRIDTVSIPRCWLSRRTTESKPETLGNSGGFWFWGLGNPCATNSRKERAFDSVNHH